jgi:carbamoyl-phosphate synthase large subunit
MVNFLITNSSGQGFPGTVYSLRKQFNARIISVSSKEKDVGSFLSDKHYQLNKDDPEKYVQQIISISKNENVDVIIPLNISERILLLTHKEKLGEIKILSSSIESIEKAENKVQLFEICSKNNIKVPKFFEVDNYIDLKEKTLQLGYPLKKVVVKPIHSSGSRGLRILNKKADYKKQFYNTRADYTEITLSDLRNVLGNKFKPLMLCEYLPGEEFTVDCIRNEKISRYFPRVRTQIKNGLTSIGEMREHQPIIELSQRLADILDLTTVFGFQFKLDDQGYPVLIDCNPRIQGTMIMSTLAGANIIAASVDYLLNKKEIELNPDWSMKYYRFWSGISVGREKTIVNYSNFSK